GRAYFPPEISCPMSSQIPHPRVGNTDFAAFHWYTDSWLDCPCLDDKFKGAPVENMARALDTYEKEADGDLLSTESQDFKLYLDTLSSNGHLTATQEYKVQVSNGLSHFGCLLCQNGLSYAQYHLYC
ncbi:hypothetical protein H0H92_013347, partial [Tricholoma furcatifolium]